MRIRTFCKLIDTEHLKDYTLNNGTIVVDAQNFFYALYKKSNLQFVFGCECDQYAAYLRKELSMFKKANTTCYFVFKGGHEDLGKRLKKTKLDGRSFIIGQEYNDIVRPLFLKEISQQVLDEMDFKYTVCQYEAQKEVIALAQRLNCPIVSYSIEFVFCGHPYIPFQSFNFNEQNNTLTASIFSLDRFLQRYRLSTEKLAVFAALTDENNFPENHFLPLIKTLKIPLSHYKRNIGILNWLGRTSRDVAVKQILQRCNSEDRTAFLKAERTVRDSILRKESPGIPAQYLTNGNKIDITEKDPLWFQKGVASKHVPSSLVNIKSGNLVTFHAIADNDSDDAEMLSLDIIKYTFNLLTNFEKKEFNFFKIETTVSIPVKDSVSKPDHIENNSPFENGWERVPKGLFEHFLSETLSESIPNALEKLPEDCRLLMVALIYFSKQKRGDATAEIFSVLLSYIALSVLTDADKNSSNEKNSLTQDKLSPKSILDRDREVAKGILSKYFTKANMVEAKRIFKPKWLHPLVEFQHCMNVFNNLNVLCGRPYKSTVYHRTYSATFVYKVLYTIKDEFSGDGKHFVEQLLNPAPTVLAFFWALIQLVEYGW